MTGDNVDNLREMRIITPRLTMSPLTDDDAQRVFEYRGDPAVSRFQPFEPRCLQHALEFIAAGRADDAVWRAVGIRLTDSGELVGDLGIRFSADEPPQVEIGVTVAPDHQRRGIAAEAVAGLLGHLFGTVRVHRVFCSVDPRNAASMALFGRVGMRPEAHFRQSIRFKGEWTDDVVFAMLRSEWESAAGLPIG